MVTFGIRKSFLTFESFTYNQASSSSLMYWSLCPAISSLSDLVYLFILSGVTYLFVIIVLKVPGHSKCGHSTKFPVRSRVKYAILQIKSPDHNVDEIKMGREDGTWGDVTDADAGVAGLDDSLQLQASFFPFPQSEKKTDSGWQSRENRRVTRVLPKLATCLIQRRNKI